MKFVTEQRFWATIEGAWTRAEGRRGGESTLTLREPLLRGDFRVAGYAFTAFLCELEELLRRRYSVRMQFQFLELLRAKVAALDSEALAHIATGDDEFVAARYCIVALGQEYFEVVRLEPTAARVGVFVGWFEARLEERLRSLRRTPLPPSRVDVATGADPRGWPSLHTPQQVEARTRAAADAVWSRLLPGGDNRIASLGVPPTSRAELEAAIVRVADRIRAREGAGGP